MSSHDTHAEAPKNADGTEHVGRAKDPAIVRRSKKPVNFIRAIPQWIALAIAFFMIVSWMKSCGEEDEASSQEASGQVTQPAPQQVVVVQKVGKEPTLYKFADFPNDCAMMELRSDASFYPKGGAVTIHPPKGGTPWKDVPGVPSTRDGTNQPPGWYMVCKDSPEAWGVEIWN